jgi:hypothetical protein
MDITVDVWLRGDNHATTYTISPVARVPREWTDADVSSVLVGMLRTLERAKNPDAPVDRPVTLRGFSWIVNPFESGGVVIALEMTLGAIVAGPFDIAEGELSARIRSVMNAERARTAVVAAESKTVH